ncbi:hypothetical protein B0H12DRAFT_828566 [Mycena haematopus]|nr:hypothetical protein B0H12DRAFT_828566 [Mycena haematopus]
MLLVAGARVDVFTCSFAKSVSSRPAAASSGAWPIFVPHFLSAFLFSRLIFSTIHCLRLLSSLSVCVFRFYSYLCLLSFLFSVSVFPLLRSMACFLSLCPSPFRFCPQGTCTSSCATCAFPPARTMDMGRTEPTSVQRLGMGMETDRGFCQWRPRPTAVCRGAGNAFRVPFIMYSTRRCRHAASPLSCSYLVGALFSSRGAFLSSWPLCPSTLRG